MSEDITRYSRHLVLSNRTWSDALLVDTAECKIARSDYAPNSDQLTRSKNRVKL